MRDFKLSSQFLQEFVGKQPSWGYNGLGYVVYLRTYSRTKKDGTQEEFWETCQRVVEGVFSVQKAHCRQIKVPWNNDKAQRSAQEMFRRMWEFKWLPPGRGLWMMGTDFIDSKGSAAINNCGMVSTASVKSEFAEPFCWAMDMSMLGVGIGFDTKGAGAFRIQEPRRSDDVHVVEDTREGWVALLRRALSAYAGRGSLPSSVDYSQVRPLGSPIAGFGGVASGPAPLQELYQAVTDLFDAGVGELLTSTQIVDTMNFIGRCVVSGNVRRSALIALGDPHDLEFLDLKNPELYQAELLSHRWSSNNSVVAKVGDNYSLIAANIAANGEPGILWLDTAQKYGRLSDKPNWKDASAVGTNPCCEQTLGNYELCCLVESFPANHESLQDYLKTLKYAYLYAKTVTLLPTHSEQTNAAVMKNRRIGCSMSGIVQAAEKFGMREFLGWMDAGYRHLAEVDVVYSDWLCIPQSIKKTSIKPSGTVSLLVGATPGIHYPHARFYIRRVRIQDTSPLLGMLSDAGYPTEPDAYSKGTVVVSFPVEEKHFSRSKAEVSMWEQLELAAQAQYYWADNQVSVTVTFNEQEAKEIKHALELYEGRLKGVSFLPLTTHGYAQPPYEEISEEEYARLMATIDPAKLGSLHTTVVHDSVDKFCNNDVCEVR